MVAEVGPGLMRTGSTTHRVNRRRTPRRCASAHSTLLAPDLRFGTDVDVNRERIDLEVWHPLFAQLDERVRAQVSYLLLDGLLGEDGVERWVGRIEPVTQLPSDAIDRDALQRRIHELADTATADRFVLGRAAGPDGSVRILAVNTALKHIDHLDKPFRLRLIIKLKTAGTQGLTSSGRGSGPECPGRSRWGGRRRLAQSSQDELLAPWTGFLTGTWRTPVKLRLRYVRSYATVAGRFHTRTDADPRWEGMKRNLLD